MRSIVAVVSLGLSAALLGAGSPTLGAEPPDPVTTLPVWDLQDFIGDPTRERAFLTAPNGNSVVELDSQGHVSHTYADLPSAADLALDADASTLFVALRETNEIAEIDLATRTVTRHSFGPVARKSSRTSRG